jgi:hypothetical protein
MNSRSIPADTSTTKESFSAHVETRNESALEQSSAHPDDDILLLFGLKNDGKLSIQKTTTRGCCFSALYRLRTGKKLA